MGYSTFVYECAYTIGGEHAQYASGTDIIKFPMGGHVLKYTFQDRTPSTLELATSRMAGRTQVESPILGLATFGKGKISVYGDSNCLDSSHMVVNCYWLLRKILDFTCKGNRDSVLFHPMNQLSKEMGSPDMQLPARRKSVNFTEYSLVLGRPLAVINARTFAVGVAAAAALVAVDSRAGAAIASAGVEAATAAVSAYPGVVDVDIAPAVLGVASAGLRQVVQGKLCPFCTAAAGLRQVVQGKLCLFCTAAAGLRQVTYCSTAPVEPENRVAFSTSCLGGVAKEWVLAEANTASFENIGEWAKTLTLRQFLQKIKERFLDKTIADKAFDDLTSIGQKCWASIDSLSREVYRLLLVPGLNLQDNQVLDIYSRALPEPIRGQLVAESKSEDDSSSARRPNHPDAVLCSVSLDDSLDELGNELIELEFVGEESKVLGRKGAVYRYTVISQAVNTRGQRMLRCTFCNKVWHGTQYYATKHFTQPQYCKKVFDEALFDIAQKCTHRFEADQAERVRHYALEHGLHVPRSGAMGGEAEWSGQGVGGGEDTRRWSEGGAARDGAGAGVAAEGEVGVDREGSMAEGERTTTGEGSAPAVDPVSLQTTRGWDPGGLSRLRQLARRVPRGLLFMILLRWVAILHGFRFGGQQRVNAICTDSASAYVGAARALTSAAMPLELRRITWLPCSIHICNKLLSDIGTICTSFVDTITRARVLVVFFKTHQAALSFFRSRTGGGLGLGLSCETRFASVYSMLERLLALQDRLQGMMRGEDGRAWARIPWSRDVCDMARWVRRQIRWSPWWERMRAIVHVMEPVMELLRRMDRGSQFMSLVVKWTQDLARLVRDACARLGHSFSDRVMRRVQACIQHMMEPAHAAAFLLNPRRRDVQYFSSQLDEYHSWLVRQPKRYLLSQTGFDVQGAPYLEVCLQFEDFHMQQGCGYVLPRQRDEGMLDAQAGKDVDPVCSGLRSTMTPEEIVEQAALISRDPIGSAAPPPVESVFGARAAIFWPYPRDDASEDERERECADDPAIPIPREIDELHEGGDDSHEGAERPHTARGAAEQAHTEMMGEEGDILGDFGGFEHSRTAVGRGDLGSSLCTSGHGSLFSVARQLVLDSPEEGDLEEEGVHSGTAVLRERRPEEHGASGVDTLEGIRDMEDELAGAGRRGLSSTLHDRLGGGDGAQVEREAAKAGVEVDDGAQVESEAGVEVDDGAQVEREAGVEVDDGVQVEREAGVEVDDGAPEDVVRADSPTLVVGEEDVVGGDVAHDGGEGSDTLNPVVLRFISDEVDPALAGLTSGTMTALEASPSGESGAVGDGMRDFARMSIGLSREREEMARALAAAGYSAEEIEQAFAGASRTPTRVTLQQVYVEGSGYEEVEHDGVPPVVVTDLGSESAVQTSVSGRRAPEDIACPFDAAELARAAVRDVTRQEDTYSHRPGMPPPPPRSRHGDSPSTPVCAHLRSPSTPGRPKVRDTTGVGSLPFDTTLFGRIDIDLDATRRVNIHTSRLQPGLGGGRTGRGAAREVMAAVSQPRHVRGGVQTECTLSQALAAAARAVREQTSCRTGASRDPGPRPVPAAGGASLGESSGVEGLGMPRGSRRERPVADVTHASTRLVQVRKGADRVIVEEDDPKSEPARDEYPLEDHEHREDNDTSREAANVAAREQAAATARATSMSSAAASSTASSVVSSSGPQLGMPTGSAGTSSSVGLRLSTSQMAGSQFNPLTPRERELRELQQVERIRERLERELKQATDREREIKNRTARLDTLVADKAELEDLDDSGMNEPMKVLRNNMLSLHAHVDSRLDFMQSTLDQILDALTRPGFRPPAQSSLPLSAMSGPFPVQADQYDFKLEYLKGEYNKVADALSRRANYLGALVSDFGVSDEVTQSLVGAYQEDPITMDIIRKLQAKDKATERQSVSMDFMDILVTSKSGKRHIFVIIDRFTKYARLVAMQETARTDYVIKLFKDNWVRDFGLPKSIVSDRDVRFTSELWKKTAEQMGSQLQMTSGNHPEANGQAEQMNRVVQHLLRHYIKPNQDDWDEQLPLIASLYNYAVHNSTDVSPNQLHLGWKHRSALDFLLPENRPAATPGTLEYGVQYEKLLQEAVKHMKKAQQPMIASENQHR
ncbi:hypothetical protein CBR_g30889 [Chara braunii]|uniref:Integrase catalytic domain-containing protein n=1 Tax=Chara braunii TaxID=69332 RepID=A0A388LDP1_CHABU|nr:hypothetical protein CBR_g30889 [Chara braunii]|eukprot:GBG80424.1 hypothetical protein CBR_g30889 [Chara braunii]